MCETQAAGSLWNSGSYFWEEKNYAAWAESRLKELISSIDISFKGVKVSFFDIVPKGYASISVRKGKKIVVFEYELKANWKCGESAGQLTIPEFNQDDLTPVVRVSLSSGDEQCKEFLRKSVSAFETILQTFAKDLKEAEGKADALQEDKSRRETEKSKTQIAEQSKGEEKRAIAEQVKASEAKPVIESSTASVWNVNAYHWETRRVEVPAKAWLTSQLEKLGYTDIVIEGEAEVSIRKGKKIVVFELKISTNEFTISNFTNSDKPKIVWKTLNPNPLLEPTLAALEDELRKIC